MTCRAYFDGSCFLNYCGIGYVIRDSEGSPICKASEYAGRGDALKAEYFALAALVERLIRLEIDEVEIYGDSRTVVCQINGQMNTRKNNRFREMIMQMREFLNERPNWRLRWIPREENAHADSLAAEGLSEVRSSKPVMMKNHHRPAQEFPERLRAVCGG